MKSGNLPVGLRRTSCDLNRGQLRNDPAGITIFSSPVEVPYMSPCPGLKKVQLTEMVKKFYYQGIKAIALITN